MLQFYSLFESLQEVSSYSRVKLKTIIDDLEKSNKSGSDTPKSKRKKYGVQKNGTSFKSPPTSKLKKNFPTILMSELIEVSTLLEVKTVDISW